MSNALEKVFDALQKRLMAGLEASRSALDHPVSKGDATEGNWRDLLERHLPHRYHVAKAFIMDSSGAMSDQIDIVVYDRLYTPILYNLEDQRIIPAEGVYAVLEVKQDLDKSNVEYAGKKAASVRKLIRTSARIVHAGGHYEPRPASPILAGILTSQSSWSPPFGDAFQAVFDSLDPMESLDLGCAAKDGGFEVTVDETSNRRVKISRPDQALVFFLMRLLDRLQSVGTVSAIDYAAYSTQLTLNNFLTINDKL
jgi:hypothetical protein